LTYDREILLRFLSDCVRSVPRKVELTAPFDVLCA